MNVEAVLVSFKVNGNEKTYEASGIMFGENNVLLSGTCLIPLLQQKNWVSSFVDSTSPEFKTNDHIQKLFFRVYVEFLRKTEKEFEFLEGEVAGVWKCPLVVEALKKLLCDWTLGHGNFERESGLLSSDDTIDLSKELISIFIVLRCKGRKENDDIRALNNLMSRLEKPSRGQEVEIVSTPFGNLHFLNSLSRGLVSNVVGCEGCIILSDARTVSGCEGGPIFASQRSREGKENRKLLGIVTCPLTWWNGEWVGFTMGISLVPVLKRLLNVQDIRIVYNGNDSDLSPLNFADEIVVLVRSTASWGSGVVLNSASGIVITCSHVVKSDKIVSVFHKGNQYTADVVFRSHDDIAYDLAVLKINSSFMFKAEARFADNLPNIGQTVTAAGFPFFSEKDDLCILPSISTGCISRANEYMIQTTCCVQSGFSGGAVFQDERLLGIIISNTRDSSAGAIFPHINFAVPSSVFKDPVLKYIKTNDVQSLWDLECPNVKVQDLWKLQSFKL